MFEQEGMKARGWQSDSPEDRIGYGEDDAPEPKRIHELDSEKMTTLHSRLMSFYRQELDRQQDNRAEQAIDEDFYDNIQWTEEDKRVLRERGQAAICYNVISTTVNWLVNSQKRMKSDYKILPRRKDGGKQAERKTKLLKYLADVNRTEFDIGQSFEDSVKAGIGWIEDGAQNEDDGEQVYSRHESWRNVLWDSAGSQKDTSDWRYIFRSKWVDQDVAEAMFPERAGLIAESCSQASAFLSDGDDGDDAMDSQEDMLESFDSGNSIDQYARSRVRLIECWFRVPMTVKKLSGGEFSGEVYDEYSRGHKSEVESGRSVVVERMMMRMHVAIMTTAGMLFYSESPYRHNGFPLTPVWGNRRARDGMPYGIIRGLRDIQEDINKRASKALAILSSNKVIMEEGAVDDLDEFRDEVAKPNALMVVKPNKRIELAVDRELAPAHIDIMSRSIAMIQQVGGVTDEAMGRTTNATSGIAISARQQQGQIATAHFFENLRLARQIQGEKQLSLIEQYFSQEKQFRITNMRGKPEYITVNDGQPENDITATKADFVISEAEWNATARQSQTEELLAVMQQIGPVAPQVVMAMLDLVVEGMDITNREELVKRIRAITGQRDPDAEEMTPEEQAKMQAQAQQMQMQQRAQMAELARVEADAQLKAAQAQKAQADIRKLLADIASGNVDAQRAAVETATLMLQAPAAVPVADTILHESWFRSRTEGEQEQAAAMAQAQAQAQAQQQQQEQLAAQQQQAQAEQQAAEQQQAEQPAPEGQGIPPQQPQMGQ